MLDSGSHLSDLMWCLRVRYWWELTMQEIIFLVEEAAEGGYTARALGYSIFTDADTWDELRIAVQDAVRCHFKEADRPALVRLYMVRQEILAA
jgi:hypothetical protein